MAKKFDIDKELSGWINVIDEMGEDLNKESKKEINKEAIYRQALEKWGKQAQVCMVFEEMAELQKELCKYLRGKDMPEDIAEEIADVEIMLEQMKLLFEIEKDVETFKEFKIERLAERFKED